MRDHKRRATFISSAMPSLNQHFGDVSTLLVASSENEHRRVGEQGRAQWSAAASAPATGCWLPH